MAWDETSPSIRSGQRSAVSTAGAFGLPKLNLWGAKALIAA